MVACVARGNMAADVRAARISAAALARDGVSGLKSPEQVHEAWPLEEGQDPSVDALAHIYFDHYVVTATSRTPDEYDISSVTEIADLIANGDPLDDERLRGFEAVSCSFSTAQALLAAAVVVAIVVYLAVRWIQ